MVTFTVKGATRLGTETAAAVKLQTLLGKKYLAVDPGRPGPAAEQPGDPAVADHAVVRRGGRVLRPDDDHRADRLGPAGHVAGDAVATTFKDSPADVKASLDGLSRLSRTVASRDDQLRELLSRASAVSGTVASRNSPGGLAGPERRPAAAGAGRPAGRDPHAVPQHLAARRAADRAGRRTTGPSSRPALAQLHQVLTTLQGEEASLSKGIQVLAPFTRVFANALGNGPWFDACVPNLVVPVRRPRPALAPAAREVARSERPAWGRARAAPDWVSPTALIALPSASCSVMGAALVWWPQGSDGQGHRAPVQRRRPLPRLRRAHPRRSGGARPVRDARTATSDTVTFEYDGKYRVPADAKAAVVSPSLVSDRYLQLLPAYTGGPALRSGGDIPLARTAVPVELDQVTGNLDQLDQGARPERRQQERRALRPARHGVQEPRRQRAADPRHRRRTSRRRPRPWPAARTTCSRRSRTCSPSPARWPRTTRRCGR